MKNNEIKFQAQNLRIMAVANVSEILEGHGKENKLKIGRGQSVYVGKSADGYTTMPVIEANGKVRDFGLLELDEILRLTERISDALKKEFFGKGTPCYAVLHSVCCDGDEDTMETLGVFSDKEHARAALKLKRDEYIELAEAGNLWIDPNNQSCKDDFTDTPDCYNIWKDGYYSTDHVLIKVVETAYYKKNK